MYFAVTLYECLDLPAMLKPTEVAEFLCIHVYKLIRQGNLSDFRVVKFWRIQHNTLFHQLAGSES